MELINIYLFMTEILIRVIPKYLNVLSPCCRWWSFFTTFTKPTSVSDHE